MARVPVQASAPDWFWAENFWKTNFPTSVYSKYYSSYLPVLELVSRPTFAPLIELEWMTQPWCSIWVREQLAVVGIEVLPQNLRWLWRELQAEAAKVLPLAGSIFDLRKA